MCFDPGPDPFEAAWAAVRVNKDLPSDQQAFATHPGAKGKDLELRSAIETVSDDRLLAVLEEAERKFPDLTAS